MKWYCKGHKCDVVGRPFFIEGETPNSWEIDQSDMYCEKLVTGTYFAEMNPDQQDAEMDRCEWEEINE